MTLDVETLEALGMGDHWEQLAIRWPLFVVAREPVPHAQRRVYDAQYRERCSAKAESERLEKIAAALSRERGDGGRFRPLHATEAERVEAARRRKREHMRRKRAA